MAKKRRETELLLEIGTEEIPSSYLDTLGDGPNNLKQLARELFGGVLLDQATVESYQTPRRVLLVLTGLLPVFEREEVTTGPKKEICYQPDGTPTPALKGFLKRSPSQPASSYFPRRLRRW